MIRLLQVTQRNPVLFIAVFGELVAVVLHDLYLRKLADFLSRPALVLTVSKREVPLHIIEGSFFGHSFSMRFHE